MNRYPAPLAEDVFSDEAKIAYWNRITLDAMHRLCPNLPVIDLSDITPEAVNTRETYTKHDVVAYLSLVEDRVKEIDPTLLRFLHYGMTSSDLTETTLHHQIYEHAGRLDGLLSNLRYAVRATLLGSSESVEGGMEPPEVLYYRPGRTHGQLAEVTTLNNQLSAWLVGFNNVLSGFRPRRVAKALGPVGTSLLRTDSPNFAVPSTQVINRDFLLEWACTYLRLATLLEELAMIVRSGSRYEVSELAEHQSEGQVGSSAMPTKNNPIQSERVCGLARVARGHFLAIAETAGSLWDDRDISNSSVERMAVPGLASTVEYTAGVMAKLFHRGLDLDATRMLGNSMNMLCWTSVFQGLLQKHLGLGPVQASKFVREAIADDPEGIDWPGSIYEAIQKASVAPRPIEVANNFLQEFANIWDGVYGSPLMM